MCSACDENVTYWRSFILSNYACAQWVVSKDDDVLRKLRVRMQFSELL